MSILSYLNVQRKNFAFSVYFNLVDDGIEYCWGSVYEVRTKMYLNCMYIDAIVLLAMGAAYGTAKSGTGIAAMSVMRPELIMRSVIPVVMAGIIGIYGLVVAAVITNNIPQTGYTLFK